jgi:replicative DNA helicase
MENKELQYVVIGAVLLEPHSAQIVIDWIGDKPDFFSDQYCAVTWWAIEQLHKEGKHIDIVTVNQRCRSSKDPIGKQMAYELSEMTNRVASSANIKTHLLILTEDWIRRTIRNIAAALHDDAKESHKDAFELIAQADKALLELNRRIVPATQKEIGNILGDLVMRVIKQSESGITAGCSSGFYEFDQIHGAFMPGTLTIVAGRPGMGKTTFVMNVAQNIAKRKELVLFYSVEMSAEELACRMLSTETEIPNNFIYRNPERLTIQQKNLIATKADILKQSTIKIIDEGMQTVSTIRATAKKAAQDNKLACIVVDYLQILTAESKEQARDNVKFYADACRDLKILSKELSVPVILLSQLSRANEGNSDKRPTLNALRGSGGIEENADSVVFMYRPSYYEAEKPPIEDAFAIVAKNRNGALGDIPLQFISRFTKFTDASAFNADNYVSQIPSSMLINRNEAPF